MPVAVITGAGSGLGRAIALELADRGFLVHATDLDADAAARTAAEIGAGARSAALDVRDEAACRALAAEATTRGGTLDLWVNNAGVLITGPSWVQDEAARRTMLEVNALGTMNGTVAALEPMIASVEDKLDDLDAAGSFSGRLLTVEQVAAEVGKLTESCPAGAAFSCACSTSSPASPCACSPGR